LAAFFTHLLKTSAARLPKHPNCRLEVLLCGQASFSLVIHNREHVHDRFRKLANPLRVCLVYELQGRKNVSSLLYCSARFVKLLYCHDSPHGVLIESAGLGASSPVRHY